MNIKFNQNSPNTLPVEMHGVVHRRREGNYLTHVLPCTLERRSDLVPSHFYTLRGLT